ncbi:EAL domain-containing protein [Poseidonibacter ostreae]|uniref:EAL domain-containing protein n=1 Tax=Poseidonibacter ostreae TaxID=2654171 RepID=A0A6L4WWM3_9BACT|nr:EAL domain-containing protein [Poseidonibacter ostreae]KAB7891257.1 EAL domain-containing protein [Poseidonibacter ostreae]
MSSLIADSSSRYKVKVVLCKDDKLIRELDSSMLNKLFLDELTSLQNRKSLKDILEKDSQKENPSDYILMYIDIKDFGNINEAYGEEFGNSLLVEIAKRLTIEFPEFETFRIEADIFGLLLQTDKELSNFNENAVKKKIEKDLLCSIETENDSICLFSTIALVHSNDKLIKKAEITLREAKKQKKDFLAHSFDITEIYRKNRSNYKTMVQKVRIAISEGKIFPKYQPIYSNAENKITRYESLARLEINGNEILTPDKFLSIAKKINKYNDITKIMVSKTLSYFNGKDVGVSLNLSLEDIVNDDVVEFILKEIKNFHNPSFITFEILEDSSVSVIHNKGAITNQKAKTAQNFFKKIKAFGCSIAIDDFGSGYSNFINIITLNPDIIKIDGTLVKNMHDKKIKLMTELFVGYAKSIGCKVVAEFVEDEETQKLVEQMGIEFSQGYLFGKPNREILEDSNKADLKDTNNLMESNSQSGFNIALIAGIIGEQVEDDTIIAETVSETVSDDVLYPFS